MIKGLIVPSGYVRYIVLGFLSKSGCCLNTRYRIYLNILLGCY
jgi:hypothetical protein